MKTDWEKVNGKVLQKSWRFRDFKEALNFVNKVGGIAEELQHHPDISIKNYNEVIISTTTHNADVITEKDFALADRIDGIN